ncbi:MAG: acyl-CoA synthetase FdrA [Elusimicrobiaceae bacterium]|nr:acyl-CoA synthetase FdrA [Elusimicrobiaceae bacterium]
MITKGLIKKGEYFDSVSLMLVARKVTALDGIKDCSIVMGTAENRAILANSGMLLDLFKNALDSDLLIAVSAGTGEQADDAIAKAQEFMAQSGKTETANTEFKPRSTEGALKIIPQANLCLISVAGKYAAAVARDALERGLNVMLFSDNVPVASEVELKKYAQARDLIVMGPDCGTAIINGVPLAFANAVNRGDIGAVAAAGTGLQEVTALISNAGAGISQAIGTGGRDVKQEVGGIAFLQGLEALIKDPGTKIILLVSKPPHREVMAKISELARTAGKPVVGVFLGGNPDSLKECGITVCRTLEDAAYAAVALSRGEKPAAAADSASLQKLAAAERANKRPGRKYVRGLFSGGTFCSEAQVIMEPALGTVYSNVPLSKTNRLESALTSREHTVVDMGDDEFTVGRPHPMIDFSLRNRRIAQEAADPTTSVILLDVVIGYGSNMAPLDELGPVIRAAKKADASLSIVCSVTGTDKDPQCRKKVAAGLEDAGALVMPSNAAACRLAAFIAK